MLVDLVGIQFHIVVHVLHALFHLRDPVRVPQLFPWLFAMGPRCFEEVEVELE